MPSISSIVCDYLQERIPIRGVTWSDQKKTCTVDYKDEATQEQRDFGDAYTADFVAMYNDHEAQFQVKKQTIDDAKEAEITWERPVPRVAEPVPEE